uniref:Uncharacterized protein n=1 Tax=Pararge aegeria TaxID=116150 RepID=S4PTC2_9NEOP
MSARLAHRAYHGRQTSGAVVSLLFPIISGNLPNSNDYTQINLKSCKIVRSAVMKSIIKSHYLLKDSHTILS